MIQTVKKRDGRIVGYDEAKVKSAIRKAMLQTEFEDRISDRNFSVSVGANSTGKSAIAVFFSGMDIQIVSANDSDDLSICFGSDIFDYSYLPKKKIHVDRTTDEMSAERMSRTIDELLGYEYEAEINPQSKDSLVGDDLSRSDDKEKGDCGKRWYDAEGNGSSSQGVKSHRVGVTNDIEEGKEHGLPGSSVTMSEAAVPPKERPWVDFREMLLDMEWDDKYGELSAKVSIMYHLRRAIHQDGRGVHQVNGLRVLYDRGVFTIIQREQGVVSLPIHQEDLTLDIMATVIAETQEAPECRAIIEKLYLSGADYISLVKYLMNKTYHVAGDFDETEIEYLDEFRDKVIQFRKYIQTS